MLRRPENTIDSTSDQSFIPGEEDYSKHVNPKWTKLLSIIGIKRQFTRCEGMNLHSSDGHTYRDFLSGYGVYNVGHNHPALIRSLIEELEHRGPTMLQSHIPELAATLARKLTSLSGTHLTRTFFTSTGSEGVESSIKFARAYTKRDGVLFSEGGFHGLTYGALSLMSNPWWKKGFGSTLPNTVGTPFGDLDALERQLKTEKFAAYITEPVQGESGILVPTKEFLREAQLLCQRYGTLFVLDEVQTGLYRTGKFLAAHHFDLEPDMVILAKAMSGGFVPVGALVMRKEISDAVYSSVEKAFVHASTFGENSLGMRAALTTLQILEDEKLGERALVLGDRLREGINRIAERSEFIEECRGLGLMNGIEFTKPRSLSLKMLYAGFTTVHPGLLGQMIVKTLFENHHILTQMCGHTYNVVKAVPPLVATEADIDYFIEAVASLVDTMENTRAGFWSQGVKIGLRAVAG
ncbi:MAG: aspartate aminotransferase family protein [Bdellovibrionales bacterium]|nr:aspartate aminotransferase family protein [Bdellovibrionales bacterium]